MRFSRLILLVLMLVTIFSTSAFAAPVGSISTRINIQLGLPSSLRDGQKFDLRGSLEQLIKRWEPFPNQTLVLVTSKNNRLLPEITATTNERGTFVFKDLKVKGRVTDEFKFTLEYRPISGFRSSNKNLGSRKLR